MGCHSSRRHVYGLVYLHEGDLVERQHEHCRCHLPIQPASDVFQPQLAQAATRPRVHRHGERPLA